ncbi:hypothetical protein JOM49_001456 [Amycolatopsis magusensis]|uniref:Uncharacterized protein n=1 Tax=Amycolatopsis magusensis TaxID=882444 RepID=A0ABS4PLZ7_9PSEU|nr:hypothetical protein [Amycolatopsis magusensis]
MRRWADHLVDGVLAEIGGTCREQPADPVR